MACRRRPDTPPDLQELPPLDNLQMVNKPVNTSTLLRAVRKALDGASGR